MVSAAVDYQGRRYAGSFKLNLLQAAPTGHMVIYRTGIADSGTPPYDSFRYTSSAPALGNSGNLAKAYHDFDGWATNEDGTGNQYPIDGTIPISGADVTLYPRFVPKAYMMTIQMGTGGQGSSSNALQYHGMSFSIWATPAAGWVFDHWVVQNGSVVIADPSSASTTATLRFGPGTIIATFIKQ